MPNANDNIDLTTLDQQPQPSTDENIDLGGIDADRVDEEYNYIAGNADSWFSVVQDPNTGTYGIEVPDIDFSFAKFDEEEDETPEKLTAVESLKNTWNDSLNQLSLVDDRFYWLSEQLFGDEDSLTFKEAEARIAASELQGGETLALTDIPEAFEDEGFIGGLAHTAAAVANAVAAFGTSAIESIATGGVGLAVDMVSSSVRDYAKQRAEEEGISIEEASRNLGAETIIPVGLGALSYSFEKAGLKGVGKAIKGMAPSAKKALFNVMNAAGKEGGTELAQGVVESFNQGFAGKRSLDAAAESVGEFWENEALETFLQGAVGGGVTAGGGRSARKAASQLRSNEAERTIVETTQKISDIDQQLNDPNVPDDQKKILKRARTALKNEFKKAIIEPHKDVRKLDDNQINQINKRGDKINEYKKELDQFTKEHTDTIGINPTRDAAIKAVKDDINNRIQKEIDGINKIYESRSTTNIREEDGGLIENETANLFFEGKQKGEISEEHARFVAEEYKPLAKSVANQIYRQHPEYGEQGYTKEDFVRDLTYGIPGRESSSLVGLAKDFDPNIGSFGGHAKKWLGQRAKDVINQRIGKSVTTGAAKIIGQGQDGTGVDIAAEDKGIELAAPKGTRQIIDKVGLSQELATKIKDKVANALKSKKLTSATKQGFSKAISTQARDTLQKDIQAELGSKDELFRNLTKNWKNYLDVIPKIALNNSRGETQQWAENPPTQQEFVNYFRGVDVDRKVRAKRKESLAKWLADGIFAEAADDLLYSDPTIAKQFELVQQFKETDAINSINAARIALINKTPISESRIQGPKGKLIKKEGATPAEIMTEIIGEAWQRNGHRVQSTTDKKLAIANLVMAGLKPNRLAAEAYLEDINGFTFKKRTGTRFIYNSPLSGAHTPIHEMGHVWSAFVLDNNPELWGQVIKQVVDIDSAYFVSETVRLVNAGYYSQWGQGTLDFVNQLYNDPKNANKLIDKVLKNPESFKNEINALDEMLAGMIEQAGRGKVGHQNANAIEKALAKLWDYIGKLLAKVKGKDIKDLSFQEVLDLAVNDVLTGKPGSSFAEMNIPVGTPRFEVAAGTYRTQALKDGARKEAEYKAMNIVSKDKSNEGINKAYAEVADHMSKDEFLDWMLKESKANKLDLTKLQSTFLEDDADSGSVEKAWQDLAGGKLTLLLGRPGKAWQNDESKIQEKFDKNFEFFKKNEALWTSALPSEFWETLGRLKKDGTQAKESILRFEDAQYLVSKAQPSGVNFSNRDAFSRIETAGKKIANIQKLANSKEYQKQVDENQQVLFIMGDAIQQLAEQGIDKVELASFIKSFTNTGHDVTNFFRKAPRLTGYVEGIETASKRIPEHNPPAGYIAQFLFQRASTGNWNQEAKDAIKDKFKYYLVPPSFDPGVHGQGATSLKAGITKGFDLVADDPFIRYAVTGADVTKLRELDGTATVKKYGIDVKYINEENAEGIANVVIRESFKPYKTGDGGLIHLKKKDEGDQSVLAQLNDIRYNKWLGEKEDNSENKLEWWKQEADRIINKLKGTDSFDLRVIIGKTGYKKKTRLDNINKLKEYLVENHGVYIDPNTDYTTKFTEGSGNKIFGGAFGIKESLKATPDQIFNEILQQKTGVEATKQFDNCLLYTSPSPRDS